MRGTAVLLVPLLVAPLLSGCFLLGPGDFYDVTIETDAVGHVLVEGTPASHADIFVSLTDADAEEPIPENRSVGPRDRHGGDTLAIPSNRSKSIHRLPLDGQGRVSFQVPTDRPVVLTVRIVESPPPFHVSEEKCPEPQNLRSSLRQVRLAEDGPIDLPFFVVCGEGS